MLLNADHIRARLVRIIRAAVKEIGLVEDMRRLRREMAALKRQVRAQSRRAVRHD
jgi:hypothetical protein